MSKIFKRIAMLMTVAIALLCMGIFASACGDAKEFTITVYYSDGTTVVDGTKDNLEVQICDASGKFCFNPVASVDSNGVAKYTIADVEAQSEKQGITDKKYVLHVWAGRDLLDIGGEVTIDSSKPTVKIVLSDRPAP